MEDDTGGGASPCFAHLLVDGHPVDAGTARDVARFRRAERARFSRPAPCLRMSAKGRRRP